MGDKECSGGILQQIRKQTSTCDVSKFYDVSKIDAKRLKEMFEDAFMNYAPPKIQTPAAIFVAKWDTGEYIISDAEIKAMLKKGDIYIAPCGLELYNMVKERFESAGIEF